MAVLIAGALFLFAGLAMLDEGMNTIMAGALAVSGLVLMIAAGAALSL